MTVEYEFATIDVDILLHPKAMAAGIEAMGLWLWAMAWSHKTGADGVIPRLVVQGAWSGKAAVINRLADRLVSSGLWLPAANGWLIWNYGKKNQSAAEKERKRAQGRERMRRLRGRHGDAGDASHGASRDAHVRDECAAPAPDSRSVSISEADHDRLAFTAGAPLWWEAACDATAMAIGGEVTERAALWLEYRGSRHRKTWAMNQTDAVAWISNVARAERRGQRGVPRQKIGAAADAAWMNTENFDFGANK